LEAQRSTVTGYVAGRGEIVGEFTEVESGRKTDRPQLRAALDMAALHRATLVIARLDRLARNVAFIANLMDSRVDFIACDMPEANRLTLHILAAVAEHEREMISVRTKAALAAARARGTRLGTPDGRMARKAAAARLIAKADQFASTVLPMVTGLASQGLGLREIARRLNERGIKTSRGREWQATTVRNLLARA
jgi:DNA invertase Pin-like site-specific DNA recombinase